MAFKTHKTTRPASWLRAALFVAPTLFAVPGTLAAAPINLVQNGTFTGTSLTGAGGYLCSNGGGSACTSQITSWQATCAPSGCTGSATPSSVMFAGTNGSAWNGNRGLYWNAIGDAPLGGNVVGIDGDTAYSSILTQSITGLKLGEGYELQFYQAASQQKGLSGKTTEQWQVSLGGGASQTSVLMLTASQSAHGWEEVSMHFIATSATELLKFVALGTPNGEPPVVLLGDVSLNDVPEPAALATLGAGLLVLLAMRRRSLI